MLIGRRYWSPAAPLLVTGALLAGLAGAGPVGTATRSQTGPAQECGPTAAPSQAPWPQFGGSRARSQSATGANVTAPLRRRWLSGALDGAIYAEPVVAGGCAYVATEDDSVYAFALATGAMVWHTHVASPVTSGLACGGDINPSGITGAPVLDTARHELWAVVLTSVAGRPQHEVVALDTRTGRVVRRQPVAVPGTDPTAEQQRSALAFADGRVYVAFGGLYGDCGSYRGAIVSVPVTAGSALAYWRTPTAREGAVWEVGGPDLLPDGRLLFATGNSAASPGQPFDGGDAVIELAPDLRQASYFAPRAWAQWNVADLDLGSTGPALLPGGLAFQVGKAGEGFLVSTAHLGGVGGQLASVPVCPGQGAYGADAVRGGTVYVPCTGGVVALRVAGRSATVLWRSSAGGAGSILTAGGRVFEEEQDGRLVALSSASGRVLQSLSLSPPVTHFPWLAAAGGTLLVANGTRLEALTGI